MGALLLLAACEQRLPPDSRSDIVSWRCFDLGSPVGIRTCALRDGTEFVIIGSDDDPRSAIVLRRAANEADWTREHTDTVPAEVRR